MHRALASLLTRMAYFTSPPHNFYCFNGYDLPMTLLAVSLTSCSDRSTTFAAARFLSTSVSIVPTRSNYSENSTAFLPISSWNSRRFTFRYSLSIFHWYNSVPRLLLFALAYFFLSRSSRGTSAFLPHLCSFASPPIRPVISSS